MNSPGRDSISTGRWILSRSRIPIALTERFARRFQLKIGDCDRAQHQPGAEQSFAVRALLKEQGTARVFGGNFAMMVAGGTARFGKEGKLDSVDLTVEECFGRCRAQERLRQRVQNVAQVERPKKRGEQIESLLSSFRVGLFLSA